MEIEKKETGVQAKSSVEHLKPWQYKKGQSGNPSGRAKGISLKEYIKIKFNTMTDEEREEYINGLDKIDLFKMAEGAPDTKGDLNVRGELKLDFDGAFNKNATTPKTEGNSNI